MTLAESFAYLGSSTVKGRGFGTSRPGTGVLPYSRLKPAIQKLSNATLGSSLAPIR
jgi:hypothetical protein